MFADVDTCNYAKMVLQLSQLKPPYSIMDLGKIPQRMSLRRFYAENQLLSEYHLSYSDIQSLTQKEVLAMADAECMGLWDSLSLGYTNPQGHPILRQEAAKLHDVNPDDVLTANPRETIYLAMNCLIPYLKQ